MANEYTSSSPYFDTPVINNQYLGVMVNRAIPKLVDDLSMTINETYNLRPDLLAFDLYGDASLWWVFAQRNPNQLQDPLGDFTTGTTIYLPQQSTLKSVLGI
jgi:alpha-L-fucosidase